MKHTPCSSFPYKKTIIPRLVQQCYMKQDVNSAWWNFSHKLHSWFFQLILWAGAGAGRSFVGPSSFCSWNDTNTSSAPCCCLKSSSAFAFFPLLTVNVIAGMPEFSSCFAAFLCSPRLWEVLLHLFPRVFTLLLHPAQTPRTSLSPQLCHGGSFGDWDKILASFVCVSWFPEPCSSFREERGCWESSRCCSGVEVSTWSWHGVFKGWVLCFHLQGRRI